MWQAAPHLVPKDYATETRTKIDLRRSSEARKASTGRMPNFETELSDIKTLKHFASIDVCAGC